MTDFRSILQESALLLADLGLMYLCIRWYNSKCSTANKIQDMEAVDLSELRTKLSTDSNSAADYAIVEGTVRSIDAPLKSQYSEAQGPIKYFKRLLLKSERHKGYWLDTTSPLSESYDKIPFALVNDEQKSSVLVTDAFSALYIEDALHTTYDHFEPNDRSLPGNVFDRIIGEITKGVQTTERLLKDGTTLMGLGKIVYNKGSLELRKPNVPDSLYILTTMSKEELVESLKSKAFVYKLMAGVFGVAGVIIVWVTFGNRISKWISDYKQRKEMEQLRREISSLQSNSSENVVSENDANKCVVCLGSRREIVLRPCGHVCVCLSCYEILPSPKTCPVCRQTIGEVIPVYIS